MREPVVLGLDGRHFLVVSSLAPMIFCDSLPLTVAASSEMSDDAVAEMLSSSRALHLSVVWRIPPPLLSMS